MSIRPPEVTDNLTEFLLARVTEDEAEVLFGAECEAKRLRIAMLTAMVSQRTNTLLSSYGYQLMAVEALPYAAHPDYRPEWRP